MSRSIHFRISKNTSPFCTEEPAAGSAFCFTHSQLVKDFGYPTKLKDFIRACGADPANYTKVERAKVKEVLKTLLSQTRGIGKTTETAETAQGTAFLLTNAEVTSPPNLQFDADEEKCTKETGNTVRLHNWTRGIFQVVGPGVGGGDKILISNFSISTTGELFIGYIRTLFVF